MPEAIVPKVGHRPKMGQYGFDRACFSVVFLFLLCFIAHLYEANGGTDMEVLACFRPCFLCGRPTLFFALSKIYYARKLLYLMLKQICWTT